MSANGSVAGCPATASWSARLDVVERLGEHDRAAVHLGSNSGMAGELGSRSTARLTFTVPDRLCHASMSATKSAGSSARSTRSRNEIFGCAVVTTVGARELRTVGQRDADRPRRRATSMRATGASVRISAPNDAGRGRHRRGHPAHAAAREAPRRGLAAGLVDVVVQHDERGAGAARAGPGADHAGDAEHAAHRVGLEAVLDQVGDARGEQPGQVERGAHVRPCAASASSAAWPSRSPGRLRARASAGSRCSSGPTSRAEAGEPRLPPLVRVGVARGELRDLARAAAAGSSAAAGSRPSRRGAKYGPCG